MINLPVLSAYGYASRVLMTVVILMLHCEGALAFSQEFQTEYVRKDVSATAIRKGTVLGTVYLASQELKINTLSLNSQTVTGNMFMYRPSIASTPDPGCQIYNGDNSIGLLRYTGNETETVCDPNKAYDKFIPGLTARNTGETFYSPASGLWYVYKLSVPRTKLFDVVINDPVKALSHAGQNLTVSTYDMPSIELRTNIHAFDYSQASSPVQVHIGETPAAVFFPLQNTSNASLTLPVRPSGGSQSTMASGSASIGLCLYDGAGLSKSRYTLTFQDENATNTSRDFGVYSKYGAGKIPYTISLTDPSGTPQMVFNRETFYWDNMQNGGAAQSRLKYVQLPNSIQGTVPCVPSTVTLKVSPVPYNSLRAGKYMGKVSILFTPSTTG